jgi:putative heme-binding domain-containing protein
MRVRLAPAAIPLLVFCLSAQEHVGQYNQADIDRGSRVYANNCSLCHGPNGDSVANADLRSGRFRHASSDEELARVIANGVPGTVMPPHRFLPAELTGLVAYIRSMRGRRALAVNAGDAERGRALFTGKGGCLTCHRVDGECSRFAPDLSEIGALREPAALLKSLVAPTAAMLPINRPVRAVTRDGKVISGRRLNEDTYSVQLIDTDDRLVALMKADLKEYTVSKVSSMPSYGDKLTSQELADIVEYLGARKGVE